MLCYKIELNKIKSKRWLWSRENESDSLSTHVLQTIYSLMLTCPLLIKLIVGEEKLIDYLLPTQLH